MLSFEEFSSKIMNGESRNRPGVGCGYILIKEKGKEVFTVNGHMRGLILTTN